MRGRAMRVGTGGLGEEAGRRNIGWNGLVRILEVVGRRGCCWCREGSDGVEDLSCRKDYYCDSNDAKDLHSQHSPNNNSAAHPCPYVSSHR
jgi:hypothetical protein